MAYRIVETDNFRGDYPAEVFVNLPGLSQHGAYAIAKAINAELGDWPGASRYWKVVGEGYQLRPGFEP